MSRRLLGAACVIAGAAGVVACLLAASAGMRDVMVNDGGSCASGGPYVVAHQCSGADMRLLLVGILGGLVATAIVASGSAAFGRGSSVSLLAWVALFGLLGWNFIRMVVHPAVGQQGATGWLISGVVFWLLAAGGLVPLLGGLLSDRRTAGHPDPIAASMQPLVRAQFLPSGTGGGFGSSGSGWGFGSAADGVTAVGGPGSLGWVSPSVSPSTPVPGLGSGQSTVARNPSAAWLGLWVVLIVLGGALGAVTSSALISALR